MRIGKKDQRTAKFGEQKEEREKQAASDDNNVRG